MSSGLFDCTPCRILIWIKSLLYGDTESRAVKSYFTKSHDGPLFGNDYHSQCGKQAERERGSSFISRNGVPGTEPWSSHHPVWFGREVRPPFDGKAMIDLNHEGATWMGVKTFSGDSLRPML